MNFIFILYLVLPSINGFLIPFLQEKMIVSNLETIISSKAVSSSIFTHLQKEIDIERVMLQSFSLHISPTTGYMYMSIMATILYGQWKFYDGSQYNKLRKIGKFSRTEKCIKGVLLIFAIVFMKDIESVT